MNRSVCLTLLTILVPACTQRGAKNPETEADATASLLAQEHAWTEAFKNRDRAALDQVLADDFIFTDDGGNVYNKAAYVAAAVDVIKVASYTVDSTTVLRHGDLGIVAGRWAGSMTIDD